MSIYLELAEVLIRRDKHPFSARELVETAIDDGLFPDSISGHTPHKTMQARLSVEIVSSGDASIFVRVQPGRFYLRELLETNPDVKLQAELYRARRRLPRPDDEFVLTIPTEKLGRYREFQGVRKTWRGFFRSILREENINYIPRIRAEEDSNYKQIVTYVLVKRKNGDLLAFKRGNFNRVANFLKGSQCVGFGGHVSESDVSLFDYRDFGVRFNAVRELSEELRLPTNDLARLADGKGLEVLGILNDDSSPVGRRHIAVLMAYEVSDDPYWDDPKRGEASVTNLRWINPSAVELDLREFEYWSQLCLREFYPEVVKGQPSFRVLRKRRMSNSRVFCVVGTIGSGKSEATNILKEDFGFHEINTGRVVADLMGIPPVPKTSRNKFQERAAAFIKARGAPKKLAKAICAEMDGDGSRYVIDGIRQTATLDAVTKLIGKNRVSVVYVHTSPDLAYELYVRREQKNLSPIEFIRMYASEVEAEIPKMISDADAVLYNWQGAPAYRAVIKRLMREVDV